MPNCEVHIIDKNEFVSSFHCIESTLVKQHLFILNQSSNPYSNHNMEKLLSLL